MGFFTGVSVYAWHCNGKDRLDDPRQAPVPRHRTGWLAASLTALLFAGPVAAQTPLRVATYDVDFSRKGPGLVLRDILRGDKDDIQAALGVIAHINPDILLLTGLDYDL